MHQDFLFPFQARVGKQTVWYAHVKLSVIDSRRARKFDLLQFCISACCSCVLSDGLQFFFTPPVLVSCAENPENSATLERAENN